MAITSVSVDNPNPQMDDTFTVTVVDNSSPANGSVKFVMTNNQGEPIIRTFDLVANGPNLTKLLHAWKLGAFPPQNIHVQAFTSTPDFHDEVINFGVIETNNAFDPPVDYFIDFLKNDVVLSAYARAFKKVRKMKNYRTETPGFYIFVEGIEPNGLIGSSRIKYTVHLSIMFLDEIQDKREIDQNKHHIFIKRVMEHIANNPQLVGLPGVVLATARRGNIPYNAFEYVFGVQSKVEIEITYIPEYP